MEKAKINKFCTKHLLFGYFWDWILKTFYHISNKHPQIWLIAKCAKKKKSLNLGPKCSYWIFSNKNAFVTLKTVWLQNVPKNPQNSKLWDQKCLLGLFLRNNALFGNFIAKFFLKIIVIFQISTLKFVKLQTSMKKQNCLNFRPKMSYWVFTENNFAKLLSY